MTEANFENKKLIIEIKDEKNDISLTNSYSFENGENNVLEIGSHDGQFTATDSDLIFKIETMNNNFTFNVYEEIQPGFKKLLASKEIRWFSRSE